MPELRVFQITYTFKKKKREKEESKWKKEGGNERREGEREREKEKLKCSKPSMPRLLGKSSRVMQICVVSTGSVTIPLGGAHAITPHAR